MVKMMRRLERNSGVVPAGAKVAVKIAAVDQIKAFIWVLFPQFLEHFLRQINSSDL